jgi:hypothetical protein
MASISRTVQFRSIKDVIDAYRESGIPSFTIVSGIGKAAQVLFVFECETVEEGEQYLNQLLPKLKQSAAIYTMCLYKTVPEDGICNDTPFRNSFNFQFSSYAEMQSVSGPTDNALMSRLEALALEVKALREEKETGPGDDNNMGMIGAVLKDPTLGPIIQRLGMALGEKLAGFITNNSYTSTAMSGVNQAPVQESQEQQQDKLSQAVQILAGVDPNFVNNLHKLAMMAQKDPGKYMKLVGFMDMM